jgi:hypothetical protein
MSKQILKPKIARPAMKVLPPRDASILALLVQHPDAPPSKREILVNSLTKEGQTVAAALRPDNRRKNLSLNALTTADGLKQWFKLNMTSLRSKSRTNATRTQDAAAVSPTSKGKSAGRQTKTAMAPRSSRNRSVKAPKKK